MSYGRYMQSERWRLRKVAYFARHPRRCRGCGVENGIELHHRTYERMGYELDGDLVPLCSVHHAVVHDMHRRLGGSLILVTAQVIRQIRAEASGRQPKSRRSSPRVKRRAKVGNKDPVSAALAKFDEQKRKRDRERQRSGGV